MSRVWRKIMIMSCMARWVKKDVFRCLERKKGEGN